MLPSCSDDTAPEIPEAQTAKLNIRLGVFGSSRSSYTKAASFEPDTEEANAYERAINDWYVVVLKNDGTVDRVLSNKKGDIATPIGDEENTHNVLGVELSIGETYQFYAFANLESLNEDTASKYLLGLTQGAEFDVAQAVSLKSIDAYQIPAAGANATTYIPMSSYAETAIVQKEGTEVRIPLIRLLGKVEVTVSNGTGNELTLKSLSIGKFRTAGEIYLLPYDAAEKKETKNLLAQSQEDIYLPSFPTNAQGTYTEMKLLEKPISIAASSTSQPYWSYANETSFIEANETKALRITTDIEGRNNQPLETDFNFIRRNDWLVIPLLISDISTNIAFDMKHMPIGGLPTTITLPEGVTMPIATYWTQGHGGDITITYTLNSVSSLSDVKIKHYTSGDTYEGGSKHPFTSAVLNSNTSNLLINVPENNTEAPWLTDTGVQAYPLTQENETSGSFTVTTQELAKAAEASIDLTLVIEGTANGETKTLVVPYTIIIKNKNQEGGNS